MQAGDLSQSPAQENLQGTDAAAAAAATQPSNAATDTAAQLQPQKPLCDITATADSPHRGSKVRAPSSAVLPQALPAAAA